MEPIPAPAERGAIALGTGGETRRPAESWFVDRGLRVVRNVSRATLTPVLPIRGRATGTAVIVLPGGGFNQLSMDNEGWPVAQWLADRGIAAFVLKYRTNPTPETLEAYRLQVIEILRQVRAGNRPDLPQSAEALADAVAAIRLVRAQAGRFGVASDRVGMLGFSAGAMTAVSAALSRSPDDRPDFVGSIYGPLQPVDVPAAAPPLFASIASDDPLFAGKGFGLIESWRRAGRPYELHVHQSGGHGYGMGDAKNTTGGWLDLFQRWIAANGFMKQKRPR